MADLNNLLGELDEPQEQDTDDLGFGDDGGESADQLPEEDAYTDQQAERAELPAALREAERLRHARPPSGGYQDEYGDAYDGGLTGEEAAAGLDNATAAVDDEDEDAGAAEDEEYATLKTLWAQELLCPELLPRDDATLDSQLELLRSQEDTIEELQEQVASGGGSGDATDPILASLAAGIYKMESDRVRFLLADLTRTRLAKIENHALHNRDLVDRMSAEEVEYLKTYGGLVERHLNRTVLNAMPKEAWRKLNEPDMIDSPDLDAYVFCKVLETVEIDSSTGDKKKKATSTARDDDDSDEDDEDEMGSSIQEHTVGSFLIARYAAIQKHVLEGRIVLLV